MVCMLPAHIYSFVNNNKRPLKYYIRIILLHTVAYTTTAYISYSIQHLLGNNIPFLPSSLIYLPQIMWEMKQYGILKHMTVILLPDSQSFMVDGKFFNAVARSDAQISYRPKWIVGNFSSTFIENLTYFCQFENHLLLNYSLSLSVGTI